MLIRIGILLQPITGILFTSSLIAFLLSLPIQLLRKRGIPKVWAILLVLFLALAITSVLTIFLGPLAWQQLNDFAGRLPRWVGEAQNQLLLLDRKAILQNSPIDFEQLIIKTANQLSSALESLTSQVINLTLSTINSALNLLVTVVLSILLVLNGEKLWAGLLSWFPYEWQIQIRTSLQSSFQGYFTGQATLGLILAIAQSIAFSLLNVPFGLLFGITIGLLSIIPFGGTVAVLTISTLLVFQDLSKGLEVLLVAIAIGQINDNVVAPRLIGGATGLNPAVVILALLIGSKFAGFLGLVLAVPTASFLKKMGDSLHIILIDHEGSATLTGT